MIGRASFLMPLTWLGRQRARAVAALVVAGIALPGVGALLKPFVSLAVFLLLVTSFLRADLAALKRSVARPGLVISATLWTMVAVPTFVVLAAHAAGLPAKAPDFFSAMMLHAIASPMMSAPAFAALMGLDTTLPLAVLVLSSALLPLTAIGFVFAAGLDLSLSPVALGLQLAGMLCGAALAALFIRRGMGLETVARYRDEIDGFNILILYVFIAALMAEFGGELLARPLQVLGLTALAFAIFFVLLGITAVVFRRRGREVAFAVGIVTSQRNMGLMLAAAGGAVPQLVWLYIAVSQFPIYLSPLMLGWVVRWLKVRRHPPRIGRQPGDLEAAPDA